MSKNSNISRPSAGLRHFSSSIPYRGDNSNKSDDSTEDEYLDGNYWDQQYKERFGDSINPLTSLLTNLPQPSIPVCNISQTLTHTDSSGKANMVDVSNKTPTTRIAKAEATICLDEVAYSLVKSNDHSKGDVLAVARVAGIAGAKKTSDLIPLCHNIPISKVSVDFNLIDSEQIIEVVGVAKTVGVTGVEMEALCAVSIAALTVYDMCKAVSHNITITDVKLVHKSGGKSDYNV